MYCKFCGAQIADDAKTCPVCQAQLEEVLTVSQRHDALLKQTPMKWYKFVIYFQLILGPLMLLSTAVQQMTGIVYGESADLVYATFPQLKTVDIIYGVILLGIAAFALYVRHTLTEYYENAPKLLIIYYLAQPAVALLYSLYVSSIVPTMDMSVAYPSIIIGIVLSIVTYVYFSKREELFIFSPNEKD
jgi:hypothetical protein